MTTPPRLPEFTCLWFPRRTAGYLLTGRGLRSSRTRLFGPHYFTGPPVGVTGPRPPRLGSVSAPGLIQTPPRPFDTSPSLHSQVLFRRRSLPTSQGKRFFLWHYPVPGPGRSKLFLRRVGSATDTAMDTVHEGKPGTKEVKIFHPVVECDPGPSSQLRSTSGSLV